MIATSTRPRLVLAGEARETAGLARELLASGLGPLGVHARTPGAASETGAHRPDLIAPLSSPGELSGAALIVLWGPAGLEPHLPEAAPGAILLFAGAGSLERAADFATSTRTDHRRVLATGSLSRQLVLQAEIARRAGVSRSQVTALVLGGRGGDWIPVRSTIRIAGIPAEAIMGSRAMNEAIEASAGREDSPRERRAALLMADAVAGDRKRLLSCGSRISPGRGITEEFMTFPSVIGAGGLAGHPGLRLTLEERSFLNRGGAMQSSGA